MSLEKLQQIRERRLEKQQKKVRQSKALLLTAEQQIILCQQNLAAFKQWRLDHQEGLFKGLQGQACTPQSMFEYRAKLEKLMEQEEQLKKLITNAYKEHEVVQKEHEQIRKVAAELALKNEKTKEIIDIQEKAELALMRSKE